MEISSLQYFFFVAVVFVIFAVSNSKYKPYILLLLSYFFYGTQSIILLFSLLLSTLINYYFYRNRNNKYLVVGFNLGLLLIFKLAGLFNFNNWLIPIGISFFTFQALSFHFDTQRNKIESKINILTFANYLAFFPQLIAGPIEKYDNLSSQINAKFKISTSNLISGGFWITVGLAKKLILADRCSIIVDQVYGNIDDSNLINFSIATLLFSFQIFLDFSAYCNIASGVAQIFNIKLSENFQSPYLSKSLSEFWQKWHITLHRWFKEYVYKPILNKQSVLMAISVVFLLSGLWHGIALNYILWAIFSILSLLLDRHLIQKIPLNNVIRVIITFGFISFGWIFFRISSVQDLTRIPLELSVKNQTDFFATLQDLNYVLTNLESTIWFGKIKLTGQEFDLTYFDFIILIFGLCFWGLFTILNRKSSLLNYKIIFTFTLLILISLIGFHSETPFIYLQF